MKELYVTSKEWSVSFKTKQGGIITQIIKVNSKHLAIKWAKSHPLFKELNSVYPV